MRIVQLIDSLEAGGAERMAVNYANALATEIEFSGLVATRAEGSLKSKIGEKVCYSFLEKKSAFDIRAVKNLRTYCRSNNIDIIHAHSTSILIAFFVKVTNPKIKIIWHDHFGARHLEKRSFNFRLKFLSLFVQVALTVSQQNKKWLMKNLYLSQVHTLPNFIVKNHQNRGNTFLKGEEGKRFVILANLKQPKNHITFLEAFRDSEAVNNGWSVHLVGKVHNDTYSQTIKNFIDLNNYHEKIFIYNSCSDIDHILQQANVGVLCSTYEGFPMALLEYGYSQLLVLSTNVGACGKLIRNYISGFLFEPEDNTYIVNLINKVVNMESDQIKVIARNFYAEVMQNYTEEIVVKQYISILRENKIYQYI